MSEIKICYQCQRFIPRPKNIRSDKQWANRKFCSNLCRYLFVGNPNHNLGEKHPMWRGVKVGYRALHHWVKRHLGIPEICIICNSEGGDKGCHWANISGQYLRNVFDWATLCPTCHGHFDMRKRKGGD